MPRSNEAGNTQLPAGPDQQGWRHWGDGLAGKLFGARLQGFYPTGADYRDVQVDANGVVQVSSAGGGGGGAVTVADGADVAQGATTDASSASTVVGLLKAIKAAITGPLTVTGPLTDTQLRAAAVPVDTELPAAAPLADTASNPTAPAVAAFGLLWNGTNWDRVPGDKTNGAKVQSAQLPAALAASGALKVDQQSALPAGANTIGKVDQGAANATPWNENLAQIAGTALAAKAVPANADGQVAIPVYVNAQQYATYDVSARNLASGVLTANTAKAVLSFEHGAASTKTVRIRRIMVHMIQVTALSGLVDVQITRGTAASSAGTAVTPQARRLTDPAAEVVVKSLPTIVAASVADNIPAGGFATTTTLYSPPVLIYDWQEAGETKPYLLVAGALQSLVINVISTAAHNLTLTISVDLTEE